MSRTVEISPFGVFDKNGSLRAIIQHPGRAAATLAAMAVGMSAPSVHADPDPNEGDSIHSFFVDHARNETVYSEMKRLGFTHSMIVMDLHLKGIDESMWNDITLPSNGIWIVEDEVVQAFVNAPYVKLNGPLPVLAQLAAIGVTDDNFAAVLSNNHITSLPTIKAGTIIRMHSFSPASDRRQPEPRPSATAVTEVAPEVVPAPTPEPTPDTVVTPEPVVVPEVIETPTEALIRVLRTSIAANGGFVDQATAFEANALVQMLPHPESAPTGVGGKVEILNPEAFYQLPRPSVDLPYMIAKGTCKNELVGKPSAILTAMISILTYEWWVQQPGAEFMSLSTLVVSDIGSGDHKTHASGDKLDIYSQQITSVPGTGDGPILNMDSPVYDRTLTEFFIGLLQKNVGPDGTPLIEHIEFSDKGIGTVAHVRGHRQHAHLDTTITHAEESDGIFNTANTGSWCEPLSDIWTEAGFPVDPGYQPEAVPPFAASWPAPVVSALTVDQVNALPFRLGDMGPVVQAFQAVAASRGWTQESIDAWTPFMIDIVKKESNGCWNIKRGQTADEFCNVSGKGAEDAGFGQVIRLHDDLLASELGFTYHDQIIESPWNSMSALVVLLERYSESPWCYTEADGTQTVHSCGLAPNGKPTIFDQDA